MVLTCLDVSALNKRLPNVVILQRFFRFLSVLALIIIPITAILHSLKQFMPEISDTLGTKRQAAPGGGEDAL